MIWANDHLDAAYLKKVLITLELSSEHPLADSVVKYLQQEHIEPMESEDFQSLTGLGATAKVNNKFYFIGNRKLMENQKILINDHLKEQAKIYQAKANTNCSQLF